MFVVFIIFLVDTATANIA